MRIKGINKYNFFYRTNLIFILLVTSILLLSAQESSIREIDRRLLDITKIEVEGDFLNSNVRCAYKDSRGFMWFGTAHGLCRYDGSEIIEFTTNNTEMPFNDIFGIFEDDQGFLWVTKNPQVTALENLTFVNVHTLDIHNVKERFDFNFPLNFAIRQGKGNVVYFLGETGVKYSYSKGKWQEYEPFVQEDFLLEDFYEVYKDFGEKGLIFPFSNKKEQQVFYNLGLDKKGNVIIYSTRYTTGGEWIFKRKIQKLDSLGRTSDFLSEPVKNQIFSNKAHRLLYLNPKTENIWSLDNYHFVLFNTKGNATYDFKLKHPEIFYDRILNLEFYDDLIWVCAANGVFTIKIKDNKFDNYLHAMSFTEGYNSCRAIYTKDNENLIVSTVDELFRVSSDGKEKIIEKGNCSPFLGLRGDTLLLMKYAVNYLINDNLKKIAETPNLNTTWCAERDKNNPDRYWLGFFKEGLGYWEIGMDSVKIYTQLNEYQELKDVPVYDLHSLDNGHILMATTLGIYEFSYEQGVIQRYWNGGDIPYHLPLNEYYYIYQDKEEMFWLGSSGGGLVKWNKETGEHQQYTTDNGFSSNIICAIYEDEKENLWIPSYNGLIRFNKKTEAIRIYKTEDGLTHNEFNRGAHFQSSDGKLYFGGLNGVNSFYPEKLLAREKEESVPLEVTSIVHFNSGDDELIDKLDVFKAEEKITLFPDEGFVNVSFSLLDYKKKGITTYAYKIEGQSEQWQYIKDNQLRISGLPYGLYTLRIKGQMSNGSFSNQELIMPLEVLRPVYLQWWFILLVALVFFFVLYQLFKWRNRWLVRRGEELEKQVNKQTKQLQKDKAIIEKQAIELREIDKLKSRFFANVSHELRTPITLIQGPVRSVLNNDNLGKDDEFLLTKVEENTEHLLGMVNELMDLTKAEAYKLKIDESNVVLYDLLKRKLSNFHALAGMKSIQFDFNYHIDKDLIVALDTDKFEKIINNLLSNAFKFTPKEGKVSVTVNDEAGHLLVKVTDTGRGIPASDIPYVFNRFYQSSINKKAEGGLGIGLSLSMEFVKLLEGQMWVESKEGEGSTFFISLPLKECMDTALDEPSVANANQVTVEMQNFATPISAAVSITDNEFLSKQTILIVEDTLDLQEYLHYLLAPHYHKVHVVDNGKEALEWIGNYGFPSLILSDLMMPIMDGFELLEQVKADKKLSSIPFVMLTARAELKDKLKALRIGVDDYLTKPFKEEELKVRINNLLSNFEERREYLMSEQPNHSALQKEDLPETSEADRKWLENLEKTIIEEIEHHYFSVDYLAEKIGVKRDKLFKKTKALTGLTPNKYVRAVRLQLAKELLESKKYGTVKEVAHKVGFQKIEYFSSLYKKQFGKLPSEYIR